MHSTIFMLWILFMRKLSTLLQLVTFSGCRSGIDVIDSAQIHNISLVLLLIVRLTFSKFLVLWDQFNKIKLIFLFGLGTGKTFTVHCVTKSGLCSRVQLCVHAGRFQLPYEWAVCIWSQTNSCWRQPSVTMALWPGDTLFWHITTCCATRQKVCAHIYDKNAVHSRVWLSWVRLREHSFSIIAFFTCVH